MHSKEGLKSYSSSSWGCCWFFLMGFEFPTLPPLLGFTKIYQWEAHILQENSIYSQCSQIPAPNTLPSAPPEQGEVPHLRAWQTLFYPAPACCLTGMLETWPRPLSTARLAPLPLQGAGQPGSSPMPHDHHGARWALPWGRWGRRQAHCGASTCCLARQRRGSGVGRTPCLPSGKRSSTAMVPVTGIFKQTTSQMKTLEIYHQQGLNQAHNLIIEADTVQQRSGLLWSKLRPRACKSRSC